MTTPAPVKPSARARRRAAQAASGPRPRLSMGLTGFLVAWLLPNLVMAALVAGIALVPALQDYGSLTPCSRWWGWRGSWSACPCASW